VIYIISIFSFYLSIDGIHFEKKDIIFVWEEVKLKTLKLQWSKFLRNKIISRRFKARATMSKKLIQSSFTEIDSMKKYNLDKAIKIWSIQIHSEEFACFPFLNFKQDVFEGDTVDGT
jgi:hypothetical protein